MGDILKEAIADAKAVRETALQNAKMALEEAFTPQLKNMLAAKLKQEDEANDDMPVVSEDDEIEDEDELEGEDEVEEIPIEDGEEGEEGDVNINIDADDDDEEGPEETYEDDEFGGEESEEETDDEIAIDDEEEMEEESLDLESIIRELESELSEEEDSDEDTVEESDEESDEYTVEEDNIATSIDSNGDTYEIDESMLDEEEEEEDEEVEETNTSELESELKEYKDAVHYLKDKLHEVNILNAKLLFTNKLFKEYSLNNNQKLNVVETFDRAQTTREIKLVYSTLAEQFGSNGSIGKKVNSIKESASSKSGTTKPSKASRKVITEESQVANRFKKLAGIINS